MESQIILTDTYAIMVQVDMHKIMVNLIIKTIFLYRFAGIRRVLYYAIGPWSVRLDARFFTRLRQNSIRYMSP